MITLDSDLLLFGSPCMYIACVIAVFKTGKIAIKSCTVYCIHRSCL